MSFILYNQVAHNYEKEAVQYRQGKKRKSFRPDDYESFPLPKTTVELLIQEIDNFQFPPSGLLGEAKVEMIKKILDYRSNVEPSCWNLRMRLKSLCEFRGSQRCNFSLLVKM